jgi:hypothetical protein
MNGKPDHYLSSHILRVTRVFNERKAWVDAARNYCDMFPWGGRTEQAMARELRSDMESEGT